LSSALEGQITIRLCRGAEGRLGARIESTRPQLAQRLMAGRPPAEAVRLAGSIFALCGRAQRLAAELATRAARGPAPLAATDAPQFRKALSELALEHAWQLLASLPTQQGATPDLATLLELRQAAAAPEELSERLEAVLARQVLGIAPATWLGGGAADFTAWCRARPTPTAERLAALAQESDEGVSNAPLLPALTALGADEAGTLARCALDEPLWCARPLWRGRAAETGAIARLAAHPWVAHWLAERGRGVGARQLARLVELAQLPARLRREGLDGALARAWNLEPGLGIAAVETARGLLLHVVRLASDRVADYRIVAPTEWNFHPAGPIVDALASLTGDGNRLQAARRVAHSLDACVAIEVQIA
jgi:hypothetical protein